VDFDPERYTDEVIKPLRGLKQLPDGDLARRYAIEPDVKTKAAIEERLRKVRGYWNQNSTGQSNRAVVCRMLLAADEQLLRQHGQAMLEPAWWQRQLHQDDARQRDAASKLTADLAGGYGTVGKITKPRLDVLLAQFPGLSQAHVDQALQTAGVRLVEGIDLPATSGLDRVVYHSLGSQLGKLGAATIVALLHPDLRAPFTLARGFAVPSNPRIRLDRAALDERIREAERLADSDDVRARKSALGVLRTAVQGGAGLRDIALFQVVDRLRALAGVPVPTLVRAATDLGLEKDDAELVVLSLPNTAGEPTNPADEVRALLEEGRLRAAQQALAALSTTDPDTVAVKELVDQARARVEQLVRAATDAVGAGKEDEARRLLLQAGDLARDDDDVAHRLRRLPMSPAREVTAVAAGAAVQLGWQAPTGAADDVRYRVVRTEGRAAASPQDGATVVETTQRSGTDPRPPVARQLHFAVFTSTDGQTWSRPAAATVVVTPPVADVALRGDPDRVTGTWRVHPNTVTVRVRRSEGRPGSSPLDGTAIAAQRSSFADTAVREGTEYFYTLIAVYHDEQGGDLESATARASVVPRAAAQPVTGLTAEALSVANDVARIRLSWPFVPGQVVRVRYADQAPPWPVEGVVAPSELERYGVEAAGDVRHRGDDAVLEADVPAGHHVFVPFSIGGTGAVIGRPVGVAVVNPPRQVEVRRTGARAAVSWVWPPGISLAELTWTENGGTGTVRRITKGQYQDEGCTVTVGPAGGLVSVRAIAVGPLGETKSPPTTTTVDGQALRLSYRLNRPSWLAARKGEPWRIRITADNTCSGVEVSLVVAHGLVVPLRPEQGVVVQRFTGLTFAGGVPVDLEMQPPQGLRKPYWVKCFVTRPLSVMVVDPPIDEMKVD
jgi:hypothetical protein